MSLDINFDAGVLTLTLNRPSVRNALNMPLIQSLYEALELYYDNADVQVVVLRGKGGHFCAGADINWMRESGAAPYEENVKEAQIFADMLAAFATFPVPTVVVAQGGSMGGALGFVAAADISIGTDTSFFCLSEVKLGLIPAVISPYVVDAVGLRQAKRYMMTAEKFDGVTAKDLGLLHYVIPDNNLEEQVSLVIKDLKSGDTIAQRKVKEFLNDLVCGDFEGDQETFTAKTIAHMRTLPSAQEHFKNFLCKK